MGNQGVDGTLKGEADLGCGKGELLAPGAGVSEPKGETVAPAAAMAAGLNGERVPLVGLDASSASAFSR